jgi:hypothetical protein
LWLVRTANAGSAFGFQQGWWIWVALAACGVLLIPVYGRWQHGAGRLPALGVGLQVGGALANLLDRLLLGGASDVLYLGGLLTWNLADVALLGGTLIATWALARTPGADGLERACLATAGCKSPHQRRTPHELILHRRLFDIHTERLLRRPMPDDPRFQLWLLVPVRIADVDGFVSNISA